MQHKAARMNESSVNASEHWKNSKMEQHSSFRWSFAYPTDYRPIEAKCSMTAVAEIRSSTGTFMALLAVSVGKTPVTALFR